MTIKTGRSGRRYSRAGMDPRGHWGAGVPASAGFMPERQPILEGDGYVFAGPRPASSGVPDDVDVSQVSVGRRYGGAGCSSSSDCSSGMKCVTTPDGGFCTPDDPTLQKKRPGPSSQFKLGLNLSRQGAQRTRGAPRRSRRKGRR